MGENKIQNKILIYIYIYIYVILRQRRDMWFIHWGPARGERITYPLVASKKPTYSIFHMDDVDLRERQLQRDAFVPRIFRNAYLKCWNDTIEVQTSVAGFWRGKFKLQTDLFGCFNMTELGIHEWWAGWEFLNTKSVLNRIRLNRS